MTVNKYSCSKGFFMPLFLVKIKIIIGSSEKEATVLVNAESERDAQKAALDSQCECPIGKGAEIGDNGIYDNFGEYHYSVNKCTEIATEHADAVKRYLSCIDSLSLKNKDKTSELIDRLTKEQLFLTTIFILSWRLSHYQKSEELSESYWGSDEDLALENHAYIASNKLMGFDVNDYDKWGSYFNKATVTEICEYSINELIKAFPEYIPDSNKLFIVACEALCIDEWEDLISNQPDMFMFFGDAQITQNAGWDEYQENTLATMPVKQSLSNFGSSSHTIIRVK